MPEMIPEILNPASLPQQPEQHLILVRNNKSTNGESRQDEIDELLGLDLWSSCGIVNTLADNKLTVNALKIALEALNERATPGAEVVVLTVGGDCTHDLGLQ